MKPELWIGGLKVNHTLNPPTKDFAGVWRVRGYEGCHKNAFNDHRALQKLGYEFRLSDKAEVWLSEHQRYIPPLATPDQLCAADHNNACKELDRTPAGEKARDLLMSMLTADQQHTARCYGYFDVWLLHRASIEHDLDLGKPPLLFPVIVRFRRGFPNGNIQIGIPEEQPGSYPGITWSPRFTLCYHPLRPYPNDDIVLAQYLALLDDPDALIQGANLTDMKGAPVWLNQLFGSTLPKKPKLILNTYKERLNVEVDSI